MGDHVRGRMRNVLAHGDRVVVLQSLKFGKGFSVFYLKQLNGLHVIQVFQLLHKVMF